MDPSLIVALAIGLLLLLMLMRVPVGLALSASGLLGLLLLRDLRIVDATAASVPYTSTARYAYIVVPMFILMGALASQSGLASSIFQLASRALRRLPGGLGVASVLTCGVFAAISGSSVATVASIGPIAVREMRLRGYAPGFAAGIIAGSGTLGVLIPPSIVLVLYAIISGEPVSAMLLAGFLPGVLSIAIFSFLVIFRTFRTQTALTEADVMAATGTGSGPKSEAPGPDSGNAAPPVGEGLTRSVAVTGAGALLRVALVFFIVIGGLYTGFFTASEASALGALSIFLLALVDGWRVGFGNLVRQIRHAFSEAAALSSMAFFVVMGAAIFSFFLVSARTPTQLSNWVLTLGVPAWLVVVLLLALMIPLGMFLDALSCLLIIVPLAHPIVTELGFSGIWFGILMVKMVELGMITPPVGLNVFVMAGAVKNLTVEQVFRGVGWFIIGDLAIMAVLFVFPSIVLIVPELAGAL